jgi:23S rRNA (guanosine2251-2'-O)-methyltransferase
MTAARVVVGMQPVREAIRVHGAALDKVLVERDGGPRLEALARFAEDAGVRVERTTRGLLDKLSGGVRHQGAATLAPELVVHDPADIDPAIAPLVVALDGITDPQNFGAVVRSAVALGATGVLWAEHGAAPLTPATFRASAGAVEHARLYRAAALHAALGDLADRGVVTIGLDAAAEVDLRAVDLRRPTVLVIGAEDKGLARNVRRACREVARLTMTGPLGSLNASVAAAVALYEAQRQRSGST